MDPLSQLYQRLRAQAPAGSLPPEPPCYEDWLEYWDDDETDVGNLRTYEHWLSRQLQACARSR